MIELKLHKPNYFLIPIDNSLLTEYSLGFSLGDIFKVKGCGILTAADELLINTKLDKLKSNIEEYIDNKSKLKLGSTVLSREKDPNGTYKILPYRAFDNRYYYDSKITARQKPELTKHESIKNNYYLGFSSTVRDNNEFQNVLITKNTPDVNFFTGKANTHSTPLYIYNEDNYYLNFKTSVADMHDFSHVLITKTTPDNHLFAGKLTNHAAPLYLKDNSND